MLKEQIDQESLRKERAAYTILKSIYEERLINVNLRIKMIDAKIYQELQEEETGGCKNVLQN